MTKEEKIKHEVYSYYKQVFNNKNDRHQIVKDILPVLNSESKVLDYGCGMGGLAKLIVDLYGAHVEGVDIDEGQIEKAKTAYGQTDKLSFIHINDFKFPDQKYQLVISTQVIEHVHNPGTYLSRINRMLIESGELIISLPNIVNLKYLFDLCLFSNRRAKKLSDNIITNYNKVIHHINGWDPYHFITLCASCGYKLEKYIPAEGIMLPKIINRIPLLGNILPDYLNINIPLIKKLSYTMVFLYKKVKNICIDCLE